MTAEQFRHVMSLFDRACDLHGAELEAFLDAHCGHELALRREVESLLSADARPATRVSTIGGGAPLLAAKLHDQASADSDVSHEARLPTLAGHYRILRVIGEGGMGIVYEAQQAHPRSPCGPEGHPPGLGFPSDAQAIHQ